MLRITKLKGAEYLINSVARGMDEYYIGDGEAPGVWRGSWAPELGLEGVVDADDLRAIVNGHDPRTDADLLAGHRERKVAAVDVTLSVPKSVSLLWAFGSPETSATVSMAVVDATEAALAFLEPRAAVARQQHDGIRRQVPTEGFAIATFAHRTSRAGDPQLHAHCLIPNIVRRPDGAHVAFDANPLHVWGKATGTVFLNHLERSLTQSLGVAWGPERNGTREMVGFSREQLRTFSKRTVAIEEYLEAAEELAFDSKAKRMWADDRASLDTRPSKDKTLTPERLRDRWAEEARAVGLDPGAGVDDLVVGRQLDRLGAPTEAAISAALLHPETGLCANESRFCEAHVVERVAAISGGRLGLEEILATSERFLASDLVLRLVPDATRRRPAEWSTLELRGVEDRLLADLNALTATPAKAITPSFVEGALATEPKQLGDDQLDAVRTLCGEGPAVRALVAPAGFGKTTTLHAAATAVESSGRHVVALAPTHKAVAELRAAGLEAQTVARFRTRAGDHPLGPDTTVIVDEVSQLATRDAAVILNALGAARGAQVWFVGDARQGQSVAPGGLAMELDRRAAEGSIPAASLDQNRRQTDPVERAALEHYRAGDIEASQAIRTDAGWEHEHESPTETRQGLAAAAVADADRHGVDNVAVLAVSHADCEDLADRIRAIRAERGELRGPMMEGPGWGTDPRIYAAGDRVLLHAAIARGPEPAACNGTAGTALAVGAEGIEVLFDNGNQVLLPAEVVAGHRPDGSPNVSHAWARTIDGAEGGTWRQVHLLGTPALDRQTGYVGQSRGQLPTHTWNVRPEPDHPASLLADERTPAEAVLDAMRRDEPKIFAAVGDPWILDRRLRAERDEHAAVIATRPPDRQQELEEARATLKRAAQEQYDAVRSIARFERERGRVNPLSRLSRSGRDDIARHDQALAGAHRRLERAEQALNDARTAVGDAQVGVRERTGWDRQHGWRVDRLTDVDRELGRHWARVTLEAVRAGEPLAFGIERLRDASAVFRADRRELNDGLPPDRRDALERAQEDLSRDARRLRDAERGVDRAHDALEAANERHWGRKDKPAVAAAEAHLRRAEGNRDHCGDRVVESQAGVDRELQAVETWRTAMGETAVERSDAGRAVEDIESALSATRPERVAAAALDPTHHLWTDLGPPPQTRGGLAAWCGIAERVESKNDRGLVRGKRAAYVHDFDDVDLVSDHAPEIIESAERLDPSPARHPLDERASWQRAVEAGSQPLVIEGPELTIDRGIGIEL